MTAPKRSEGRIPNTSGIMATRGDHLMGTFSEYRQYSAGKIMAAGNATSVMVTMRVENRRNNPVMIHRIFLPPLKRGMFLFVHSKGQQGHEPGPLDLCGQFLLVPRACAGNPSRQNLSPFSDEILQNMGRFIVDGEALLLAEFARLSLIVLLPSRATLGPWRSFLHIRLLHLPVLLLVQAQAGVPPWVQDLAS